jgi:hypothetical protein
MQMKGSVTREHSYRIPDLIGLIGDDLRETQLHRHMHGELGW